MTGLIRLFPAVLLAGLLGACAQGAQTVRLGPQPEPPSAVNVGEDRRVALEVLDGRADPNVGELRNRNKPAAPIKSAQPVDYVLQLAAAEALEDWGFRAAVWDDEASRRLVIEILTLRHTVEAAVPHDVETVVELGLRAFAAGDSLEATASARSTDQVVALRPSAERTAQAVNKTLETALERLFDRRLAEFLATD